MKGFFGCLLVFTPFILSAQFGVKAGLNFANISKAKEINEGHQYSFIPDINEKNNRFQLYAGFKFGKEKE